MADFYFILIPTVPEFVPEAAGRERARDRFASFVRDAQKVTAAVSEQVEFVCAMDNFETVSCPACGTVFDDGWWGKAMDAAYGTSGFGDLRVTVPCCGAATSLNDLIYHLPQGFARFVLSAFEPQVSDVEEWQLRELEDLLGCTLRKIWVHV